MSSKGYDVIKRENQRLRELVSSLSDALMFYDEDESWDEGWIVNDLTCDYDGHRRRGGKKARATLLRILPYITKYTKEIENE